MHRAVLHIPMDKDRARMLMESLRPEERSETGLVFSMETDEDGVLLSLETRGISDMRAAINSYMRLVMVALAVTE